MLKNFIIVIVYIVDFSFCTLTNDFCIDNNNLYNAHPNKCDKYITCIQGIKFVLDCPASLYWDVERNMCDWKERAKCGKITTTPRATTTTATTTTTTTTTATTTTTGKPTTTTSTTPAKYQPVTRCIPAKCKLPYCRCPLETIPGSIPRNETPQMVLVAFDRAVKASNYKIYVDLFNGLNNPNGCPIRTTYFVSHKDTRYDLVKLLSDAGHEIADRGLATINHLNTFWRDGTYKQLEAEIIGQKNNLKNKAKITLVRGWRSPYLYTGDSSLEVLQDNNFTYDSSIPTMKSQRLWPYTLGYQNPNHPFCGSEIKCPKYAYPGLWEIPVNRLNDGNTGFVCSYIDGCGRSGIAVGTRGSVYNLMMENFKLFYNDQKQPFNIFATPAFLDHSSYGWRIEEFKKFMNEIRKNRDVYFVSMKQAIQWVQNPTPLSKIKTFKPWSC